jgi:hypothetical protein
MEATKQGHRVWGARIAYVASPWLWPRPAIVGLILVDIALTVGIVMSAVISPGVSVAGRVLSGAVGCVVAFLVFLRPGLRSWRRWKDEHST